VQSQAGPLLEGQSPGAKTAQSDVRASERQLAVRLFEKEEL